MEVSSQLTRPGRLSVRDKSRRYPLDRRLGAPQIRPELLGEDKHYLLLPEITALAFLPVARRYTD
jgi:hypothetical protein